MRSLPGLPIVLVLAVLAVILTGCVSTNGLESEQPRSVAPTPTIAQPAEQASCTREIPFDAPFANALDGTPVGEDMIQMTSTSHGYTRGKGACTPAGTLPGPSTEVCTVAIGDNPANSEPVDYMFAAGATEQLSARVTGKTERGSMAAYVLSSWRFASAADAAAAPLVDLVESCDGVIESTEGDRRSEDLFEGDEPHLRLVVANTDVLLYRAVRLADGSEGLSSTASGLLPAAVVDHLETWWLSNAAGATVTEP